MSLARFRACLIDVLRSWRRPCCAGRDMAFRVIGSIKRLAAPGEMGMAHKSVREALSRETVSLGGDGEKQRACNDGARVGGGSRYGGVQGFVRAFRQM